MAKAIDGEVIMSIASEIARLQGVKGNIIEAIRDKGVDVPSSTMLGDCPALIEAIPQGLGSFIMFGDRKYRTVVIDNQEWMAENLEYTFGIQYWALYNGINRYGFHYTAHIFSYIEAQLKDGWRIPYKEDFEQLVSKYGIDALRSDHGWNSIQGTNSTGLNLVPSGRLSTQGESRYEGEAAAIWTKTVGSQSDYLIRIFMREASITYDDNTFGNYNGIRLVRDL